MNNNSLYSVLLEHQFKVKFKNIRFRDKLFFNYSHSPDHLFKKVNIYTDFKVNYKSNNFFLRKDIKVRDIGEKEIYINPVIVLNMKKPNIEFALNSWDWEDNDFLNIKKRKKFIFLNNILRKNIKNSKIILKKKKRSFIQRT